MAKHPFSHFSIAECGAESLHDTWLPPLELMYPWTAVHGNACMHKLSCTRGMPRRNVDMLVMQAIADAQAAQPDSSPVEVTLAGSRTQLPRRMTLAELRRHKRTFVKLVTQNQFSQLSSADGAALTFLQYLTSST